MCCTPVRVPYHVRDGPSSLVATTASLASAPDRAALPTETRRTANGLRGRVRAGGAEAEAAGLQAHRDEGGADLARARRARVSRVRRRRPCRQDGTAVPAAGSAEERRDHRVLLDR